ncbi:hypothetical protein SLE2022_231760 [Rubroshorea leprosula]
MGALGVMLLPLHQIISSTLPSSPQSDPSSSPLLRTKQEGKNRAGKKHDGESGDILRNDTGCLHFLAIHGESPCLDRSSSRRKERKIGEGSGDQESQGRAASTSQREGLTCLIFRCWRLSVS